MITYLFEIINKQGEMIDQGMLLVERNDDRNDMTTAVEKLSEYMKSRHFLKVAWKLTVTVME